MITVIFGPMASGKTFHRNAFAAHYQHSRVSDGYLDGDQGALPPLDGDLMLTTLSRQEVRDRVSPGLYGVMRFIPINIARRAIGVAENAPKRGCA